MADGKDQPEETFGLFDDLDEEPYGMVPLANLTAKGGPTMIKAYERIASYNWYLEDNTSPTIVVPGFPRELKFWGGGLLQPVLKKHQLPIQDRGVLIYDVNHLKLPQGPLDPIFLVSKMFYESTSKPCPNFQEYDLVTDAINLQKLFAFCSGGNKGIFRIDFERVGKMILATRRESSDLMQIDYESYDHILKAKSTVSRSKLCNGPYHQLQRIEGVSGAKPVGKKKKKDGESSDEEEKEPRPDDDDNALEMAQDAKTRFLKDPTGQNPYDLSFIPWGEVKPFHLMSITTYPQAAGFPFYTWPQLFFSGLDSALVGWWKGTGDFGKPATYNIKDINKLLKPLPLVAIGKVHDCLKKVINFLIQNDEDIKIALVWKGKEELEIFFRRPDAPGGVSDQVKAS